VNGERRISGESRRDDAIRWSEIDAPPSRIGATGDPKDGLRQQGSALRARSISTA
jgi:hypothetical protein